MGFTEVLDRLKNVLVTNKNLQTLSMIAWKKQVAVKVMFRKRVEIPLSDMPVILITRPAVRDRDHVRDRQTARHTVRLYCGFVQNNHEAATAQQVDFEEAIDDALTKGNPLRDMALETNVTDSVNDEGYFHPTYFTVMDVEILHERKQE